MVVCVVVLSGGSTMARAQGETATAERTPAAPIADERTTAQQPGTEPSTAADQLPGELRVVVAGSAPFVIDEGNVLGGISVETWREVASALGWSYRLDRVDSVSDAIAQVEAGRADLAVGPISITDKRAERVSFTQPHYDAGLGIAAPVAGSAFDRIKPFLTVTFLSGAAALLLVLIGVGTAVWLAERKVNPDMFPAKPSRGIGNGVWFALVTMTTVGYGDRVPLTRLGRVVTGMWMLLALLVTSSLVAFIASALTLSQIDAPQLATPADLRGEKVAVVEGTTSTEFARRAGARPVTAANLPAAVEMVTSGDAAAIVFDRPTLEYYLLQHPEVALTLSPGEYQEQGYGFALPRNSPRRSEIDVALLRLQRLGRIDALAEQWLGPRN